MIATTSFSATFNLCSPLLLLLFLRGKIREKATTNSPLLKAFLVVVVFVLAFGSFTKNDSQTQRKENKRRNDDDDDEIDDAVIKVARAFLLLLFSLSLSLSLSLSGSSFPPKL